MRSFFPSCIYNCLAQDTVRSLVLLGYPSVFSLVTLMKPPASGRNMHMTQKEIRLIIFIVALTKAALAYMMPLGTKEQRCLLGQKNEKHPPSGMDTAPQCRTWYRAHAKVLGHRSTAGLELSAGLLSRGEIELLCVVILAMKFDNHLVFLYSEAISSISRLK